ncbi:MAG: hypothetical protein NZM34_04775 [Bernardetiaceae bacterium]|nr:hypothetical protein [Bernardetiaceae bacterium]
MKKFMRRIFAVWLLWGSAFLPMSLDAQSIQPDSLRLLFQQLSANQNLIRTLQNQRRADSLRIAELQKSLQEQVNNFNSAVSSVDIRVREFDQRMKITDRDRYLIIQRNLISSVEVFDMLNQRLNILEALNQVEEYQNILTDLNNPANESLGFSYNRRVMALIDQYIAANARRDRNRIIEAARMVLENPVLQTMAGPAAPILGVSNSLLSFATTLFVSRNDIPQENVVRFRDEMMQFTQYYARLNELNRNFALGINSYQVQTANLQSKLRDFVVQNIQASGRSIDPNLERRAKSISDYLNTLFLTYNAGAVREYLARLEREATEAGGINYGKLIRSGNLIEMNKRIGEVIFLYKEFEYLYSQYISLVEKNNREMVLVLQEAMARKLSDDNNKVRQQIERLSKVKDATIDAINKAINLQRLKNEVEKLDTFFPSM